jgi:hypothetical protein
MNPISNPATLPFQASDVNDIERKAKRSFLYQIETNQFIPNFLRSKRIEQILSKRFLEQRKIKPVHCKIFRIKEVSSKTFQEQKGANRGVSKLFGSEGEEIKAI